MTVVFMFPGQSSRDQAMFTRLERLVPGDTKKTLEQAGDLLGRDLAKHYSPDNAAMFDRNRDVQVGVFLANHAFLRALGKAGVEATLSLGLSLGEYNHLVHIGALSFEEALRLVDRRGACYDAGPAGVMVSVFPIELADLQAVVVRARTAGNLDIANFNSPTQFVLSGERQAVQAAVEILDEELFVEAVTIEQRVPMHSSSFEPVARAFRPALDRAAWQPAERPYMPNVLAELVDDPSPELMCDLLERHVYQPVRWRESIDLIVALHPDAVFVEVGPRTVLYNLLRPSWHANRKFRTDSPEDVERSFEALVEGLLIGA